MRRWQSIAVLVIGTVLWSVQPAYANLWDWLQEFSGPGPFHARRPNLIADFCGQPFFSGPLLTEYEVTDPTRLAQSTAKPVICLFADARFFANNEHDNFGVKDVKLDVYEFGASAPLHRAVSLGFGAGRMHISTPNHDEGRWVLTTPRLVIKPVLLYGTNEFWATKSKWWYALAGSVKFYLKADIVVGSITDADFGASSSVLNQRHERLASAGFTFDAGPLLAALNHP
jgi:hypothetical protein